MAQTLADRIRKRLKTVGISPRKASLDAGHSDSYIQNIFTGKSKSPREEGLHELAKILRTTARWLARGEGQEELGADDQATIVTSVPLVSWVSAGQLIDTSSQIPDEEARLLRFTDLGQGDFIALEVQGDSMDRISPEGSVILVNRTDKALVPGRAYVFSQRGEATYKLWQPKPDRLEPFSTNPTHKIIFPPSKRGLFVVGRVRRTILDL